MISLLTMETFRTWHDHLYDGVIIPRLIDGRPVCRHHVIYCSLGRSHLGEHHDQIGLARLKTANCDRFLYPVQSQCVLHTSPFATYASSPVITLTCSHEHTIIVLVPLVFDTVALNKTRCHVLLQGAVHQSQLSRCPCTVWLRDSFCFPVTSTR